MYDIEQLSNAQSAVYVMSNPDGSDCEFLNLQQKASASELEALRARWAGRDLHGAGVAFLAHGIPRLVLKEVTLPSECVSLSAVVLREIDPRGRRGVGMWKSALSISKVCGKGGKNSFIVFPRLSTDRHFHACFGWRRTQAAAFARAFSHSVSNSTGLA